MALHGAIHQASNDDGVLELIVIRFVDGWKILCGGRRWGRFESRVDAEDAALRLHAKAQAKGAVARVMIQEASGELRELYVLEGDAVRGP